MLILSVAIPLHIYKTFDYLIEKNYKIQEGCRVLVPFNNREIIGIITKISHKNKILSRKLKYIIKVIDFKPIFSISLWRTLNWASEYYHFPIGKTIFYALPNCFRKGLSLKEKLLCQWTITKKGINTPVDFLKKNPKQQKALLTLLKGPFYFNEINKLKLNLSSLRALSNKGLCNLIPKILNKKNYNSYLKKDYKKVNLNIEQSIATETILKEKKKFITWLLFGVTGSGKTEVYLSVINNILLQGKQILILVPEIGLTFQFFSRFKKWFDVPVEILHSKINTREKLLIWFKTFIGENAVVIGTRSSIFIPFQNLGMIVIDEEHDNSYKNNRKLRYHTRDLAIFIAREEGIPIILGTATPSLETLYNVKINKYKQINLYKKINNTQKINSTLINIRGLPLIKGISYKIIKKMKKHLLSNNKVLFFLNRRGFAPVFLCHQCGWIAKCESCEHNFTVHKKKNKLYCHICNRNKDLFHYCLECTSKKLVTIGLGTEQLEIKISSMFPKIPIIRIDRDTTNKKNDLNMYLKKIKKKEAQILIGTQMLSKGYDFPDITMVILLEVDSVLFSNNFRATENLLQLYTQVIGRSGRTGKESEIFLQTYYPNHPLFKKLIKNNYIKLACNILKERSQTKLPPFTHHVLFQAFNYDNKSVLFFLSQLEKLINQKVLIKDCDFEIIGPIQSIIPKSNNQFHWRLILSHPSRIYLNNIVNKIIPFIDLLSRKDKVNWFIDVDPIDS